MRNCRLCPRRCGADRNKAPGFCGAGIAVKVAKAYLHPWEEPCLAGERGAGAVFFSHCSLGCIYCQNEKISRMGFGIEVGTTRLSEIFLQLQKAGAATLDLVTPTHYVPQIIEALDLAKERRFRLPVVYNSSGYELTETLKLLEGYVDIFLPDLKYLDSGLAGMYSQAPDYFDFAAKAIRSMYEQVGEVVFDSAGLMRRGVLVRHLVLPGHRKESMAVLDWLFKNFGDGIYVSLMSQYTPPANICYKNLQRRLTSFEYDSVVDHAMEIGMKNVYVQEKSSASANFIPNFDGKGTM